MKIDRRYFVPLFISFMIPISGCFSQVLKEKTKADIVVINYTESVIDLNITVYNENGEEIRNDNETISSSKEDLETATFENEIIGNLNDSFKIVASMDGDVFDYNYVISCENIEDNRVYIKIVNKYLVEFDQTFCG